MLDHGLENALVGVVVDAVSQWEVDGIVFSCSCSYILFFFFFIHGNHNGLESRNLIA